MQKKEKYAARKAEKWTDKMRRFVIEYAATGNGALAARRAGYSENSARQTSAHLLTNPYIMNAIEVERVERSERIKVTADKITDEYAKIAFFNIIDILEKSGKGIEPLEKGWFRIKDITQLSSDITAAIKEIKKNHTLFGVEYEVKFHDKQKALQDLARIIGMIDNEKSPDDETLQSKFDKIADAIMVRDTEPGEEKQRKLDMFQEEV